MTEGLYLIGAGLVLFSVGFIIDADAAIKIAFGMGGAIVFISGLFSLK